MLVKQGEKNPKAYGKVRDHLSWFQRNGEEAAQKA